MKLRRYLTGGALMLALALTACGGGGGGGTDGGAGSGGNEETPLTVGTGTEASLEFNPKTIGATPNTKVRLTFTNNGTLPHNLTFQDPINVKTSDSVAPGVEETIEFTTPGPGAYNYVCTLHPGMQGTLTVQ